MFSVETGSYWRGKGLLSLLDLLRRDWLVLRDIVPLMRRSNLLALRFSGLLLLLWCDGGVWCDHDSTLVVQRFRGLYDCIARADLLLLCLRLLVLLLILYYGVGTTSCRYLNQLCYELLLIWILLLRLLLNNGRQLSSLWRILWHCCRCWAFLWLGR